MRTRTRIGSSLVAAALLTACGGSDDPDRSPPAPARDTPRATDAPPRDVSAGACASDDAFLAVRTIEPAVGRRVVDRAAARATATGHRFSTELTLRAGALTARGQLDGRRSSTNASVANLRWRGAASLLLPDLALRIVGDRLYLRRGTAWRDAGSASGVALDVGRELLDHPTLLRARSAEAGTAHTVVGFVAPPARLRAYATTERRGPVTDLLRATRRLELTSVVAGDRLVGDSFVLVTRMPASIDAPGVRPGSHVTVRGETTYCRLRPADRAPISAPSAAP